MTSLTRAEAVQAANALRLLFIAGDQFRRAMASHLEIGLTEAAALTCLSSDFPVTPRDLAQRMSVTPSAITAILDKLESGGFIQRRKHRTDRRQLVVILTEQGMSALLVSAESLALAAATPDREGLAITSTALRHVTDLLERHLSEISGSELPEQAAEARTQ